MKFVLVLFAIIGFSYLGFFLLAMPFSFVFLLSYLNMALVAAPIMTAAFLITLALLFIYLFLRVFRSPLSRKVRTVLAIGVFGCLPACVTLYGWGMKHYTEAYIFPRQQQGFSAVIAEMIKPASFQGIVLTPVYLPGFEDAPYAIRLQFTLNASPSQLKRSYGDDHDKYTSIFFDALTFDLGAAHFSSPFVRTVSERPTFRTTLEGMQGSTREQIEYFKRNGRWTFAPFFADQFDTTPTAEQPITFVYYLNAIAAKNVVIDTTTGAVAEVCFDAPVNAEVGKGDSLSFHWGYKQPGNGGDLSVRTRPELIIDLSKPLDNALAPYAGQLAEMNKSMASSPNFTEASLAAKGFFRVKQRPDGAFCMTNPASGYGSTELSQP
ncbi:MAG: hypothetical protein EB060_08965 [Proteobacteria bacterium]|nr:hypothetical protein [Pseudomonadota bacterium]